MHPHAPQPGRAALLPLLLACLLLPAVAARAQQGRPTDPPQEQQDEVIRVTSELVQTDVMVFDKQGRFVPGLQPTQFELRVDGRPQTISFFEMIRAGSVDEELQLAAARGRARAGATGDGRGRAVPLDRGRTIIFFVDDLHISAGSLPRARAAILRFVNDRMGQNDEAAVVSTTGQPGFLQQLTGEKAVLRAAVERLTFRQRRAQDMERPPMSDYQALQVERRENSTTDYFVQELLRQQPSGLPLSPDAALGLVQTRASMILAQSSQYTQMTLTSLKNLVRTVAPLPGRKLLFLVSDGFLLNERSSGVAQDLRAVTDAAARSGTIIYSIDARGLSTGLPDAADGGEIDSRGQAVSASIGGSIASQEGMHVLARDTGGRAFSNTNDLQSAVAGALKETEVYYLLAWSPDAGSSARGGKFARIEVKIPGRDDLTVRVRRGFIQPSAQPAREASAPRPARASDLLSALRSTLPRDELPTALYAGYIDTAAAGTVVAALVQVEARSLEQGEGEGRRGATLELVGVVLDGQGKTVSSFQNQLTVPPAAAAADERRITYTHQHPLPPGLYQVRVATRDARSGRTGSAMQWAEVPDLKGGKFSLSSVFLSTRLGGVAAPQGATQAQVFDARRRFARDTRLQFVSHVYNAARTAASPPDVAMQIQLLRDDQPVVTTPLRKIDTADQPDPSRLPYAAELDLTGLPPGQYLLLLTAIDRSAKLSASQRVSFSIE